MYGSGVRATVFFPSSSHEFYSQKLRPSPTTIASLLFGVLSTILPPECIACMMHAGTH